uniref:60S ribosomal subunit assembly/export protein LOC1 n=1 Tax=Heterorhabditis bacteriophora TaxID=37862 RepID=A0A1I7XM57_HETBA
MERNREDILVNRAIAGEINTATTLQQSGQLLSRRASTGGLKTEFAEKEGKKSESIDKPTIRRYIDKKRVVLQQKNQFFLRTEERTVDRPNIAKRAPSQPIRDGKKSAIKHSPARETRRPPTVGRKTDMIEGRADNTKETEDRLAEKGNESDGSQYGPRERNVNDVHTLLRETQRLNSADVRSRAEYLRMQRDKLLALKKKERDKQMQEVTSRAAQERPRTAKAARGIMRGGRGPVPSTNDDVIAARKALVEKLKTEVATPSS